MKMSMKQLKTMAKEKGLTGYSRMKSSQKDELVARLLATDEQQEDDDLESQLLKMSMRKLKSQAKTHGIKKVSKMKLAEKPQLVAMLIQVISGPTPIPEAPQAPLAPVEEESLPALPEVVADVVASLVYTVSSDDEEELPLAVPTQEELPLAVPTLVRQHGVEIPTEDEIPVEDEKPLCYMTVKELRAAAKEAGLKGYSKLKKNELLTLLDQ